MFTSVPESPLSGVCCRAHHGYGGYHFDPDIAVNQKVSASWGVGWWKPSGMVYSINRGKDGPPAHGKHWLGQTRIASIDVDRDGRFHVIWNQGIRGYNEVYIRPEINERVGPFDDLCV